MIFSTEIAIYLRNCTRWAHGCYGTLIGSLRWRIDTCRFRWPWVTLKSGREGPYFFQNDLLNDARTVSAVTHFAFEGSDCQRGVRRSFSATSERFWPDASPDAVNDSRRNRNRRGSGEGPLPYAEPRLLLLLLI